jgi:hypothetical protein
MIRVKVSRNIFRKGALLLGLNLRQLILSGVCLGVCAGEVLLLKDQMDMNSIGGIVFLTLIVFVIGFIFPFQGKSLIGILISSFKGVDKRPFMSEGVYNREDDNENELF